MQIPATDHTLSAATNDPGPGWQLRYWTIFLGQAVSMVGSGLTQFVLLWWIADTVGTVSALASAGLAALLPQALLAPVGGICADRYCRRMLMIVADTVSALCMAVLIYLFLNNSVELWHVYTMMAIRSSMQAFQGPASAASTAMLVPQSFIPRAAGLNQTLQGVILIASAPLGALAISLMPMGYALSIDVFTALLGVVPLLFYAIPQPRVAPEEHTGVWREFRDGFNIVWKNPGLVRLYGLMGLITLLVIPSFTLVPLLVKEHFGGGVNEVAMMEGIAGLGMIIGGILAAMIAPKRKIVWVLWGFALACFTLALTGLAPSNMIWLATIMWTLSSITFILGNAPLTALLLTTIPNELQGRALSLLTMISALAAPVGLALGTPLGEMIGVRWLFVVMGVAGGFAALAGFLSPALRAMDDEAARA